MNRSKYTARPRARGKALFGLCGLLLCLATPARAQYVFPGDPTPPTSVAPGTTPMRLAGIGSVSALGATGFRLTPSFRYQRGAVWLIDKQLVSSGFQTTFQFRLSNPGGLIQWSPQGYQRGGDGFAFVIQNYGIPVVGYWAGYLGYHGIPNSLAVEFDTWWNAEPGFFDPNGNHVSVHTRGLGGNSASESASLGRTTAIPFLKDGLTHTARIDYTPGTLRVFVDNTTNPALTIPGLDLSNLLRLSNGTAWLGFTAGTGSAYQSHDVLSWQIGGIGFPLAGEGTFPVTAPPSTLTPPAPNEPFILPPPPTSTTPTTPPTTGTNPPFNFPPY
jgi:hypothetical protein